MRKLLDIADRIEKIPQFFGRAGSWLMIPLIAVIMFDVLTRKLFGGAIQQAIQDSSLYQVLSPTKLQEWEWHLHGALFMLAIGFSYTMNAHVRVDVLREKVSDRKQAWIEMIGLCVFLFPYTIVIGILCADFVYLSYASNEVSVAMTGLTHRWIIKAFLLLCLILVFLAGVTTFLRHIVYLFGAEHLRDDVKMNMLTSAVAEHLPHLDDEDVYGPGHTLEDDLEHSDVQADNDPHPEIKY
ncbi:MAG: TRAP transporter small permease subunit [Alphaproteobacteria bacterium]|nr:TRAP transporter small permease subunit [Alphaproteobacteria bacterium]MCB9946217.1 TRAP transporter small permease subunit [Rhodospirillaceae bacterium]